MGTALRQILRKLPICIGIFFLICFFHSFSELNQLAFLNSINSCLTLLPLARLCLAFLALSCVGYAIPFVMCAAICCCFPCLISLLRLQEDLGHTRGATQELIDALPTYKFKPKRSKMWVDHASSSENLSEGGILGPGTKKERIVSAEDAVSIFHVFISFSCLMILDLQLVLRGFP